MKLKTSRWEVINMPFADLADKYINPVGSGELYGDTNITLSTVNYQDGLKIGRFAQNLTVSSVVTLSNLTGAPNPIFAGVVLRSVGDLVEFPGLAENTGFLISEPNQAFIRQGMVTVELAKSSGVPAQFDPVYVVNAASNADNGNATTSGDGAGIALTGISGEYIKEVKPGFWLIRIK